jgi:hypothetical protein
MSLGPALLPATWTKQELRRQCRSLYLNFDPVRIVALEFSDHSMESKMSVTRRFMSEDGEDQSIDVPALKPPQPVKDEDEAPYKTTIPDDPSGDYA